MKVLCVLFVTLALAAADLTCENCRGVALKSAEAYTSDESIKAQLDYFLNSTCDALEEKYNYTDCTQELSQNWPIIAKSLFSSESGWFAPSGFCEDLECNWSDLDNEESGSALLQCDDCVGRLDISVTYFTRAEILADIVYGYQWEGFCDAVGVEGEEVDECRKKIVYTLPRIMAALEGNPDRTAIHTQLCTETISCVSLG